MRAFLCLSLLAASLAMPALAQNKDGPTLTAIRAKGRVDCSASIGNPGFSIADSQGIYRGIDSDTCRAVAAAVLGDAAKVKFLVLNAPQRLTTLQTGEIDMLVQSLTWSQSREAANGLEFTGVNFYDGQGFLVHANSGVKHASELQNASICTASGSTSELNMADWARANKIAYRPVIFERIDDARQAYEAGRCDAFTTDVSQLSGIRTQMKTPAEHIILPEVISKEPLGIAVRKGDDQWLDVVKWTMYALVTAEELGVTQANADEMLASPSPPIRRLLGVEGDHGKLLGLDNRWALWAIKAVGNYGELFDRNLGEGSVLKLPRGVNALWSKGGLMYAPPIR